MNRRAILPAATLALAMVTASAAPARAEDEVGLSLDRRTWTANLAAPLFDPGFLWVPGDAHLRSFWVRNAGPTAADLTVTLRVQNVDGPLVDDLAVAARVQGGTWQRLATPAAGTRLTDRAMPTAEAVRVDIRVAFDPGSHNQSQSRTLPLHFVVRLTQDGTGDGPGGLLPETGNAVPWWLPATAAGLLGLGLVLVGLGRRRESSDG